MKLTILTDNAAAPRFLATHGFSCYIESDINILFDFGPDDTFLKNANRLNIEIKPDFLVLSHGHWDHGNGLKYAPKVPLICHPACFTKRFSKFKDIYVGIDSSKKEVESAFELKCSDKPLQLSPNSWFLGEIPRLNNFEGKSTNFIDSEGNEDFIPDDSALAINTEKGLVIISGCAHAGICNTVDYAKKITGISTIYAVFGGFHLKSPGHMTSTTIKHLKELGVKEVHPSHCTSLPALTQFYKNYRLPQVLAGNYYFF